MPENFHSSEINKRQLLLSEKNNEAYWGSPVVLISWALLASSSTSLHSSFSSFSFLLFWRLKKCFIGILIKLKDSFLGWAINSRLRSRKKRESEIVLAGNQHFLSLALDYNFSLYIYHVHFELVHSWIVEWKSLTFLFWSVIWSEISSQACE